MKYPLYAAGRSVIGRSAVNEAGVRMTKGREASLLGSRRGALSELRLRAKTCEIREIIEVKWIKD